MYTPGKIIYFDPFYFKGGGNDKKYFLVIKNIEDRAVIVSLPSSIPHIPDDLKGQHGCIDLPLSGISCYIFTQNTPIATNGFFFPLETYLHGHWIDEYEIRILENLYRIEGVDYEEVGCLTDVELQNVIDCFKKSEVVKRKFRKLL